MVVLSGVLAVGLATSGAGLPAAGASTAPALTQLTGQLLVAQGEGSEGGATVTQTALQTDSGVVSLDLPASELSGAVAMAGQRVRVLGSGSSSSVSFAAATVSPLTTTAADAHVAAAADGTSSMRVAVVMMRLPGSTAEPVTKSAVQASTFGATNSVAHWFSQMSGGQVAVTGKVYGYFDGVKSCDIVAQTQAAEAAAAGAGYVASAYDHLVVYAPSQVCGFKGMAWVGSNGVFLNGTVNRGVIEHELGHNLGLLHAGRYACGTAPVAASCLLDYGDTTDVMGDTTNNRGYSAEHKFMLGWLSAAQVTTVAAGTQTIALTASENPSVAGSTQLIHVRAADGTLFAVDRRASVGYDTGLSGVWIRRVENVRSDDTALVRSTALAAGQTFTDAARRITIKTLTDSGPTASVRVCVGPCAVSVASAGTVPVTARAVASAAKTSTANSALTMTVPAGRGIVAGHTVVVATYTGAGAGAVSCSDSRGNVYSVNVNSVGAQRLIVCSASVKTSLPPGTTISTRYPGFSGAAVSSASDFSGIRGASRVDKTRANAGSSNAVTTGATPTTTHAAEVLYGVEIHQGASTFAPSPVYTRIGAASFFSGAARMTITPAYRIVSATGAYKFGGTLSSAAPWRAAILTFVRA